MASIIPCTDPSEGRRHLTSAASCAFDGSYAVGGHQVASEVEGFVVICDECVTRAYRS